MDNEYIMTSSHNARHVCVSIEDNRSSWDICFFFSLFKFAVSFCDVIKLALALRKEEHIN